MNLRQKAKRYKRLYEESLSSNPYPIVYVSRDAKHIRVRRFVNAREIEYMDNDPQRMRNIIENAIIRELKPVIWKYLKIEYNTYTGDTIYTLDVWM